MKLSREEAWAGTLESMVDNRVVFYLRRYNRDYQDYSRQMKELCEKYPAIIQLIDGNNGVTLNDEEYQVFKTYSELSSNQGNAGTGILLLLWTSRYVPLPKVIKRDLRNEGKGTGTKKKGNFGMYEAVPIGRSRKGVPL